MKNYEHNVSTVNRNNGSIRPGHLIQGHNLILRFAFTAIIALIVICWGQISCWACQTATATAAVAVDDGPSSDFRIDELPGYQSYVNMRQLSRVMAQSGRAYKVRWSQDGKSASFTADGVKQQIDLNSKQISDADSEFKLESLRNPPAPVVRVARAKQRTAEVSPDKKWVARYKDYAVVLEPNQTEDAADAQQISPDGQERLRYGTCCWVYGEELDQKTAMWWSPDSKKIAFYRIDESEMKDYPLSIKNTSPYPAIKSYRYPKSGNPNPRVGLIIYDLESKKSIEVDLPGEPTQYVYGVRFSPTGKELLFNRTGRRQDELDVIAADVETGKSRVVVSEKQSTWQNNSPLMRFLEDGERFIWETERTGWANFELRNLAGEKLADLSDFEAFPCKGIQLIDEQAGWVYYSAFSDSNPYNLQLHRVQLDGSQRTRITTASLNHSAFEISPDHNWVIATGEQFDVPRSTSLYATAGQDSQPITLTKTKLDRVTKAGLPQQELFEFTSDDGKTKIFGTLHKPANFDPNRKYPLLIDVYGGPLSNGIRNRYSPARPECEFGYVIAKIGNRGTIERGKAFEAATYMNLGGPDLDDQAAAVRFLTQRDYIDGDRVGIYGHSYGGYMSAMAILRYPDLFHVAVSGAPVTSWFNYDTIYTERYMRLPKENKDGYRQSSCMRYVKQLQGKLLLVHGLVDDNVHPSNTWQLIKALQDADKRFDLMVYPGYQHGIGSTYNALRWEYFHQHLRP